MSVRRKYFIFTAVFFFCLLSGVFAQVAQAATPQNICDSKVGGSKVQVFIAGSNWYQLYLCKYDTGFFSSSYTWVAQGSQAVPYDGVPFDKSVPASAQTSTAKTNPTTIETADEEGSTTGNASTTTTTSDDGVTGGIVPCGRSQDDPSTSDSVENAPCTLCHLVIGAKRLLDWGLRIMTFFAVAVIVAMGILYIVSVGDTKMIGQAKEGLKASLYGFTLMLLAWLLVAVILGTFARNLSDFGVGPNWYEFHCNTSTNFNSNMAVGQGAAQNNPAIGAGGGKCSVVQDASNACAVQNMPSNCFGGRATEASKICNFESGGNLSIMSGTDRCEDGASFSHGLWQINLVTGGNLLPAACQGVFTGNMDCFERTTNSKGVNYCSKRKCRVAKPGQLNACLQAIRDPKVNTGIACKLYNTRGNFGDWPYTRRTCGIN